MAETIVQQCRGLVLNEADDWKVVCFPFSKFFNYGESNAATIDWETASVYEKLDGSLMSIYFHAGQWHVASSGKPDASGPMGKLGGTMAKCFWQTWNEFGYQLPDCEECQNTTFMFEFMTPWNQVIVRQERARIALIGARSWQQDGFIEYPPTWFADWGWEVVQSYALNSLATVLEAVQTLKPLESEGYVVCDANFNRVKVKSPAYVALHHLRDSFSSSRLIEIIQQGEGEEFLTYFPDFEPAYLDLKQKFEALIQQTGEIWLSLPVYESQKEFAMAVKHLPCSAVLFALRAKKVANVKEFYAKMHVERLLQYLER